MAANWIGRNPNIWKGNNRPNIPDSHAIVVAGWGGGIVPGRQPPNWYYYTGGGGGQIPNWHYGTGGGMGTSIVRHASSFGSAKKMRIPSLTNAQRFLGGRGRLPAAGLMGAGALLAGKGAVDRFQSHQYGSAALYGGMSAAAGYAGYMAAFQKQAFRGHLRNAAAFVRKNLGRVV